VVYAPSVTRAGLQCFPAGSPAGRPAVGADRIGKLVGPQVSGGQASPPVAASALGRISAEISCEVIAGRVDDADGDAAPGLFDGEPQVAVVGDHEGGVDLAAEDVQQEVRGDVDVGALLLAVRVGDHEHRAADRLPGTVLDHHRPGRADQARSAAGILDSQRRSLDPRHVGSVLDVPGSGALNADGFARVLSVSCGSPGNCAAGGFYSESETNLQAFVASERNGRWGMAIQVPGSAALNAGSDAELLAVVRLGR
jgi:hypothetical protein